MPQEIKRNEKVEAPETPTEFSYRLYHPSGDEFDDQGLNKLIHDEMANSFLNSTQIKSVEEITSLSRTLIFIMKNEPTMDLTSAVNFFVGEVKTICTASKSLDGKLMEHLVTQKSVSELRYKDSSHRDKKDQESRNAFNNQEIEKQWRMIQ